MQWGGGIWQPLVKLNWIKLDLITRLFCPTLTQGNEMSCMHIRTIYVEVELEFISRHFLDGTQLEPIPSYSD